MNNLILYERSFASHERSKYWSKKNRDVKPEDVFKSSHKKYWFDCIECNHSFDSALSHVSNGKWCSYCANQKLCIDLECIPCFNKSFASHKNAKYWSKKNEDLKPRDVFKQSHVKYLFDCDICHHMFDCALSHANNGKWCPYCANKKLCGNAECILCLNNSFASHEKVKFWSDKNGDVEPRNVFKQCNKKYLFDCTECNHSFDSTLNNIVAGNWCPYCSNHQLCEKEECVSCFNNSFASHEKAKFWSKKNGDVKPRSKFKQCNTKYLFDCNKCNHVFDSNLNNIINGSWCPYCINKTEQKLYDILIDIYPTIIRQFKQEWCKKHTYLPFDFCILELKIIIELDGAQHFIQVSNWSSPEEQCENDKYKEKCAEENGYSIIRIIQEDVFNDTYDWLAELVSTIEQIKISDKIENHYLCKNNEYHKFIVDDN